jgi:RNA polymerase sigma factor (sigma-70 family)
MRERRAQVVRYAMRLCISPADAEDATQEVLLSLARYIGALREVAALSSWLFAAARTHCTRLARRSLRHALTFDDAKEPLALEGPTPEEQLVDRQLRARLAVILSEIDAELRDVLVRRDILGESGPEVATALGIPIEAMKSRLHRARETVKERLLASLEQKRRRASISEILRAR